MPIDRAGNTFAQARSLNITSGKEVFKDWIDQSDTKDIYTFTLNKSSNIKLQLGKLKGNLDLDLLDQNGNQIAQSHNKKKKREVIKQSLEAGTYYIQVKRNGGNSKYKLKTVLREFGSESSSPEITIPDVTPTDDTTINDPSKAERVALIEGVLELTNLERTSVGLSPLVLNQKLNKAAQIQSEDLALNDFFDHTSPTGKTLADRLEEANYKNYVTAGENIAAGQITAAQVVAEWMASPSHKENILDPEFTEMGVGHYFLENDTGNINYNNYWAQAFGTPMS